MQQSQSPRKVNDESLQNPPLVPGCYCSDSTTSKRLSDESQAWSGRRAGQTTEIKDYMITCIPICEICHHTNLFSVVDTHFACVQVKFSVCGGQVKRG